MVHHDPYERLRGKRFIALMRCSTLGQEETSIPDQLAVIRSFAKRYGMIELDVVELPGVSGSTLGNREDLQALLERKRSRDDFEILLLQDTTRLTRGGTMHGMKTEFDFRAAGIEIVFVLQQMPEGPAGDLYKTFQYYSANEQARSIAKNAARGAMSAMEQGRLSHTRRPPFAIDRMYVGSDGKPRHILRNLSDGTQVKLDPQTGAVIERLGRSPKTGKPARYLKQPDESVRLVMGDRQLVEAVGLMFRRHLVAGRGGWRIAAELESMRIPAPSAERWNKNSVMVILGNPIYTGVGIANRLSSGIYAPSRPSKSWSTNCASRQTFFVRYRRRRYAGCSTS